MDDAKSYLVPPQPRVDSDGTGSDDSSSVTTTESYMDSSISTAASDQAPNLQIIQAEKQNTYRNRSNFHGTNISRIPKMDSVCDFIFTNTSLYNIHGFVFVLIEFDGAWHFQSFR